MKINGLILSAGMSSRMGDFKPLMKIQDKTIIQIIIDNMIESGVENITVVLGHRGKEIEEALVNYSNVSFVYNNAYQTTHMLESVKLGVNSLDPCDYFFLTPVDMPAIDKSTYKNLISSNEGNNKVVFATVDGWKKHPPLISYKCKDDILSFEGKGLRALWETYDGDIKEIAIDDPGCTMDADYMEDFIKIKEYFQNKQ